MGSIALALCGGAARGYACIGVLKTLESMSISVHAFAGTSMGALIAALAAAGYTPSEIEAHARKVKITDMLGFDFENVFDGIFSTRKLRRYLSRLLPATFEELKYPLYVTTVDIDTGEIVIFSEGKLLDALLASCAVPIIFKPVIINKRRLVDGGLKALIPWQPLLAENIKNIVCVSCGFVARKRATYKGLANIAIRALDIFGHNMIEEAKLNQSIIILEPDIEKYGIMSFKSIDAFIAAGELVAKQRINDILSLQSSQVENLNCKRDEIERN